MTITCPISASGTSSTHFLEPPLPFLSEVLFDRRADFFLLLVAKLGKINEFREQINELFGKKYQKLALKSPIFFIPFEKSYYLRQYSCFTQPNLTTTPVKPVSDFYIPRVQTPSTIQPLPLPQSLNQLINQPVISISLESRHPRPSSLFPSHRA